MKIIFDTHTHSTISDGGETPEKMLKGAVKRGFQILALTDHFDIHERFPEHLSRFDGAGREESYNKLADLKNQDFGLIFLNGIEIAQAHHHRKIAESWLSSHDYDFVLGSCHIIRGNQDFYHMDYTQNPPNELLKKYFEELIELCGWCCSGINDGKRWFDSLAHLTYPLRYIPNFGGGGGSIDKHKVALDKLFTLMVKHEIALEINTGHPDMLCPELPQIERYYELGGRLITIGSDSHSVSSLAQRIDLGIKAAKAAGFTECAYYENRNPKFIKL